MEKEQKKDLQRIIITIVLLIIIAVLPKATIAAKLGVSASLVEGILCLIPYVIIAFEILREVVENIIYGIRGKHEDHDDDCCCGHDHEEHHEEHDHCCCGHDHDEHHEDHDEDCCCGHDHEEHHDHCCCGHDHEEHHDHCCCGHDHDEHHHHEHEHHHDHSHGHEHSHGCACGCSEGEGFSLFDENFLMAVASIGAFVLGDFFEAVLVILLFTIGELFEDFAVSKTRDNISNLMDIRPDYVNVEEDGKIVKKDPTSIPVGTEIVVYPGEKVPLDGILLSESGKFDTSSLTGESVLRESKAGDEILSGVINMSASNKDVLSGNGKGILKIKTTKLFGESTVSKILDLVENSQEKKSKSEDFIRKFAKVYTPIVCYAALALAIVPPILIKLIAGGDWTFATWIYRALTFLVISCPCALVISVPLSFFAGIGGASRAGILIKGANYMETLANVKYVAFDKTGTLTNGKIGAGVDDVKEDAQEAISALKKLGIRYTIMVTGDRKDISDEIGTKIGLDKVYSELLPQGKVEKVEELLKNKEKNETVAFVGDGVNDAPVLALADLGIAMGALGTDAAVEAADVVLMDDKPLKISKAIKIAKKCMTIVKENIWFAIAVKLICLVLGAVGIANMWLAIFCDTGVMILAVLNAIRALNVKNL